MLSSARCCLKLSKDLGIEVFDTELEPELETPNWNLHSHARLRGCGLRWMRLIL